VWQTDGVEHVQGAHAFLTRGSLEHVLWLVSLCNQQGNFMCYIRSVQRNVSSCWVVPYLSVYVMDMGDTLNESKQEPY
jgi:hypothetical protein